MQISLRNVAYQLRFWEICTQLFCLHQHLHKSKDMWSTQTNAV